MTTQALSRRAALAGMAAAGVFSPAILKAQGGQVRALGITAG